MEYLIIFSISRNRLFRTPAKNLFIKHLGTIYLLAALALLSACTGTPDRFYIPKEISINSGTVLNPTFKVEGFVDIENAQANDQWIQIGAETHDWLANLNRWTDTAIKLLKSESKATSLRM